MRQRHESDVLILCIFLIRLLVFAPFGFCFQNRVFIYIFFGKNRVFIYIDETPFSLFLFLNPLRALITNHLRQLVLLT